MNYRPQPATLNLYVKSACVYTTELAGSLEIGRQTPQEPTPYSRVSDRLIIASIDERDISRRHLTVELIADDRVRVTNRSSVNKIVLGNDDRIAPGEEREAKLPVLIGVGNRVVQVEPRLTQASDGMLESFVHQTAPPGRASIGASSMEDILAVSRSANDTEYLLRGLHATVGVFQLATSSTEFLALAAQAMVDVVGLEAAATLSWADGQWDIAARAGRPGRTELPDEWQPSRTILERVREERRTFRQTPAANDAPSLLQVKVLVAAPILNHEAEVIGALYGDRRIGGGANVSEISEVEAMLVELLATGVASGLARLEQEKAALAATVRFEQFFTAELSRQLEANPDMLLGKDTEVTLLFCDIRGFSQVSDRLGARLTLDWVHDVMETLSECVAQHDGVLVDALGDELIGMWGAPDERADHAELACRAAMAMFEALPALNRRWQSALDEPMDLGIGIHTGVARVGNIGSTRKFKYGPLGNAVHVANKTLQATAGLAAQILISDTTATKLPEEYSTRRLGRLGDETDGDTGLFELGIDTTENWPDLKRLYEAALDAYERSDLPTATRLLGKVLTEHPGDRPALRLMAKINGLV